LSQGVLSAENAAGESTRMVPALRRHSVPGLLIYCEIDADPPKGLNERNYFWG